MNYHPSVDAGKTGNELAEDLLAKFTGLDRAELCKNLIGTYFMDLKYGNKREERAACDFLNTVQRLAARNIETPKNTYPKGEE